MIPLPWFVDERPYDGRSIVVPLPQNRRFQVTLIFKRDKHELGVKIRAFVWVDDE